MEEPAGLDIRYTYITDTPHLRRWLNDPLVQKWFPVSEEKEIEDAVRCWIGFSKYSASLTATFNGTPCGIGTLFLMPYRKVAHHCIFKIVVDPAYQKRGIGASLLRNLKHLAKNYFHLDLIHLEVYEGNPIVRLLEAQNFHQFVRQEKYVKDENGYRARLLFECYL